MVKCPFCGFANEEGALFCEQCKSDVSSVTSAPSAPSYAPPTPMPESMPHAKPIPMAMEEAPVMAAIVEDMPVAHAMPVEEEIMTAVVEEEPMVAAVVIEETPAAVVAEIPSPVPPGGPMMPAGEGVLPELIVTPAVAVAAAPAAVVAAPAPAAAKAASGTPISPGATVKLVVQRGLKVNEEYSIFAGENFIGRADEKPVDVDLTFQEPEDRVWCSRQHALVIFDDATGVLTVEDLNSANGTFVNRERVYPGQPKQLFVGSTVQIGTVHMRVKA